MSELIKPPSKWKFRLGKSATDLAAQLGSQRLLSIKAFLDGTTRVYSCVSVEDVGLGGSWSGRITPKSLTTTLGKTYRLTALDCFEDRRGTFCAAAWVKNTASIFWNWSYDRTPTQLDSDLNKDGGKLISLRAYKTTLGGKLSAPAIRYCAIWVKDDGIPWSWIPDADADSIEDTLDANKARLVSIDNLDNTTWLGDGERFCAVWYENPSGQTWFWNVGLGKSALPKEPPKFCSWSLDVVYCDPGRFASVMEQYPKPADPKLANLLVLGGSGSPTLLDSLFTQIDWSVYETNLSADPISAETAFMFMSAEGGWSWWSADFIANPPAGILGLPETVAGMQTWTATPSWSPVTNYPKWGVLGIRVDGSGGTYQDVLSRLPLAYDSYPPPTALPIQWPVFLGVIGPVEVVKLTNGKNWVTVACQLVNPTGRQLSVTNARVRVKDQSNATVHKA
jgi:hypothetical protein